MIYTCYFSGLGDRSGRAVSLCVQQPPGFKIPVAEELAPPPGVLWKLMRHKISERRFTQLYSMRFGILDPQEIAAKYDNMILTAWEGYKDRKKTVFKFSHRHLVAEWLIANGIEVMELAPMPRRRKIL